MNAVKELDNATFRQEVLESELPVLVAFTARWCNRCLRLAPIVEEIAEEYSGKVEVTRIDTDDNPDIATQFDVQSLPSLLLFRDGEEITKVVRVKGKITLRKWIEENTLEKVD